MYKIKMSPISPQCSHFKFAQVNFLQKITLIIKISKNKLSNSSVGREINYEKDLKLIYRGPMRHSNGPLRL